MRILVVILIMVGCDVGPMAVRINERPLTPLPIYPVWYEEAKECMGQHRERAFETIKWFVADELYFEDLENIVGIWRKPDRITMLATHLLSERAVKHEMIHHLRGVSGHAPVFGRCSGLP